MSRLWVATILLVACVRGGFDTAPDGGDARVDPDVTVHDVAIPDGSVPDAVPDGSGTAAFDPRSNACTDADEGPFVKVASFATPSSAFGVWYVAPYILVANMYGGLVSATFDGTTFTQADLVGDVGWAEAVWSEGDVVYLSSPGTGLRALRLGTDGKLSELASDLTTVDEARRLWGDGQHLYVPNGTEFWAYSFDGTALTAVGTPLASGGWANGAWSDGATIYFADNTKLRACTFDGTSFTELATASVAGVSRIWGLGGVVHVATDAGVAAYKLTGGTLQKLGEGPTEERAREVWSDGVHVFVAAQKAGIYAFSFDGSAYTEVDRFDTDGDALGVVGDGQHIYVGDRGSGLLAFSGFACRTQTE